MTDMGNDARTVLTLDAGGTNLVFSAMRGGDEVVAPLTLPSRADALDACLGQIMEGFSRVREACPAPPVAISFAFPGPADYPNGIIGKLGNLPAFCEGNVPLGPMLEDRFSLPVFINNDGDLFAYGEAMAGFLPWVNERLAEVGSPRRYSNLFGATLGTGFGGGIVSEGRLLRGDNSLAGEIWLFRDKLHPAGNIEEGVGIRALRQSYAERTGLAFDATPEPRELFEIATGERPGPREAAVGAFHAMAESAGDALASAATLIDGLVVIGGGLSGAAPVFLARLVAEMNGRFETGSGPIARLAQRAFNLEDPTELETFCRGDAREVTVPGSGRKIIYDPLQRIGVGLSRLGTSRATSVGAYTFALSALDRKS